MSLQDLKSTPLLQAHKKQNARLVPFAGWQMPVEYRGILQEHRAVRQDKGLFDLSHMGEIEIPKDSDSFSFLQKLITNDVSRLKEWEALYTVMCDEEGKILDDMVVYNLPDKFFLVVNASNTEKIFRWIEEKKSRGVVAQNQTDELALLAVQGPNALEFLQPLSSLDLSKISYYHAAPGKMASIQALISRTGYTGEDGFELYVHSGDAEKLWNLLVEKGIVPIGLGARDTLRLEAAYLLYGNDMDESATPLEAGLSWVVKFDKGDFIGKSALLRQKESGIPRRLVGFTMQDRAVPRHGYPLASGEKQAGVVTSGTFSPSLGKGIGLGYVEASSGLTKEGLPLEVEVRGEFHPALISKRPFVKGSVKSGS